MSRLIVMVGESGSGKSTLAQNMKLILNAEGKTCVILSTDNYWIRPDGTYSFNVRELEQAHQWNFDKFKQIFEDEDLNNNDITVIIDNTNLRFSEYERYARLAVSSGWKIEVIYMPILSEEELFKRNRHNVPLETIRRQLSRRESKGLMIEQIAKIA